MPGVRAGRFAVAWAVPANAHRLLHAHPRHLDPVGGGPEPGAPLPGVELRRLGLLKESLERCDEASRRFDLRQLADRSVTVDHVTIYRPVRRFTPEFIEAAQPRRHPPGDRWFAGKTILPVQRPPGIGEEPAKPDIRQAAIPLPVPRASPTRDNLAAGRHRECQQSRSVIGLVVRTPRKYPP